MSKPEPRELNFKDYLIVAGLTVGALSLIPLFAVLGFALQFAFVVIMPAILVGSMVYALTSRAEVVVTQVQGIQIPSDVRLYAKHSWARKAAPKCVVVGVDDFAQRLLGTVDVVQTARVGTRVNTGDVLSVLLHGHRELGVRAPVSGVVSGINPALENEPSVVNHSPYGRGWLVEITPEKDSLKASLKQLLGGGRALRWMRSEVDRLVALTAPATAMPTLADGGEVMADVSASLDDETWDRAVAAFFS